MKRANKFIEVVVIVLILGVGVLAGHNVVPSGTETEQNEAALAIALFLMTGYAWFKE